MSHDVFGITFSELLQLLRPALHILIILILSSIAFKLAARVIILIRGVVLDRADNKLEELKRIETLSRVFRYLTSVVITIVTIMLLLSEVGISIAPILAGAGVVGLAIGFGAQSLVKDFFSGFFLLLENQIRQGDMVEIAGKSGLVQEVTLRYIKLIDYSGNVHFIPNGTITAVTNMSREFSYSVMDIGTAYDEDIDQVIAIMRKVGADLRADDNFALKILEDIEIAGVEKLADAAVVIKCRFKVMSLEQWNVRREYLKCLKRAFDEHHIEYRFAS